jgi:hypothetical protein
MTLRQRTAKWAALAAVAALSWLPTAAAAAPPKAPSTAEAAGDRRLILVTLDGLAWNDVFRGADPERAANRAFVKQVEAIRTQFLAPADRATALMPFLHGVMGKHGVLIGDRDHGSCAEVTNDRWFSYPGYNEILTGKPDPAIVSNNHGPNANVTFLEWLNRQAAFKGRVEAIGSWGAFDDIINVERSGVAVNAGLRGAPARTAHEAQLDQLQRAVPQLWEDTRLDAFTQAFALEALKTRKPRVLYVAFDETDDFAHDGRYDQTLWAAHRADAFVAELWRAVQADPAYAGKTTLIVTADHGRGEGNPAAWRNHGKPVFAGSGAVWIAAMGPGIKPGSRVATEPCAQSRQLAATALQALGQDWKAFDPSAGVPLNLAAP